MSAFDSKTQLGHKTVTAEEKNAFVGDVFDAVASRYDLMNDVMSLGIHRYWKERFVDMIRPRPGMSLIDMAGGTGDIACRVLERCQHFDPPASITICDRSAAMLAVGRDNRLDQGIVRHMSWVTCDAAQLPFPDNSFDVYTISFGLRNLTYLEQALQEARRVLKPGGQFLGMEFAKITNPLFRKIYDTYAQQVIPRMGALIAGNQSAYQYLVDSIEAFLPQEEMVAYLDRVGFQQTSYQNLTNGVVAIYTGIKVT